MVLLSNFSPLKLYEIDGSQCLCPQEPRLYGYLLRPTLFKPTEKLPFHKQLCDFKLVHNKVMSSHLAALATSHLIYPQLGGKTITRPLKSEEVTAFLKRQQLLASQKNLKTTTAAITTLPLTTVAGVKGITVSGLTIGTASGSQKGLSQGQQGTVPMKALAGVPKMNFQQILQMQKMQAKQQQLVSMEGDTHSNIILLQG